MVKKQKPRHPGKAILAGGISGAIEICITYPTEFVKTQIQLYEKSFSGNMDCVRKTMKNNGVFGLYRGLPSLLFFAIPKNASRFAAYESAKNMASPDGKPLTKMQSIMCGLAAGATEAILVVTPQETMKVKLIHDQVGRPPAERMYKGFFHGVRTIAATEGLRGTYQGLLPTIVKQSTNQAMRFLVYNSMRPWVASENEDPNDLPWYKTMLCGGVAGAVSVFGNTPIDVVKTRMQGLEASKYKSSFDCAQQILKREGFRGFYKGTTARLGRVVADVALVFTIYEKVVRMLDGVWDTSDYEKEERTPTRFPRLPQLTLPTTSLTTCSADSEV